MEFEDEKKYRSQDDKLVPVENVCLVPVALTKGNHKCIYWQFGIVGKLSGKIARVEKFVKDENGEWKLTDDTKLNGLTEEENKFIQDNDLVMHSKSDLDQYIFRIAFKNKNDDFLVIKGCDYNDFYETKIKEHKVDSVGVGFKTRKIRDAVHNGVLGRKISLYAMQDLNKLMKKSCLKAVNKDLEEQVEQESWLEF